MKNKLMIFVVTLLISFLSQAKDINYVEGKTISLMLSYVNPNYIEVNGDIIQTLNYTGDNITSSDTTTGGMVIIVNNPFAPFTFFIQTKKGLVIPVEVNLNDSLGTYYSIVSEKIKKSPEPKKWEKSNNYESDIVDIATGILSNSPEFTGQKAPKSTPKIEIKDLDVNAKEIFVGNKYIITKYTAKNTSSNTKSINEKMFKGINVRAVFFDKTDLELEPESEINVFTVNLTE